MERPWVRSLFTDFCSSNTLPAVGDIVRRIDRQALVFMAIDRECADPGEVSQRRLIGMLGAEGLRRGAPAVAFLVTQLALPWSPEVAEEATEIRRVSASRVAWSGESYAPDLIAYGASLSCGKPITARTHRLYLKAAWGLLAKSRVRRAADLTQWHVSRYLGRTPGQSASLRRFLSWLREYGGSNLQPPKKTKVPANANDAELVGRVAMILEALDRPAAASVARALLATAIALLHRLPLSKVISLSIADVTVDGETITLWPSTMHIVLPERLRPAFMRSVPRTGEYVFPGRNGIQPMSASAVDYHLKQTFGLNEMKSRSSLVAGSAAGHSS